MSQIQQIKEAINIIDVIGEKVTLQRAGTYWKANCPFHSEKSPSFFVTEQFQRYKCYGCGEHGDVFTFLEKYDGLTFGEALKTLAERAGIQLESYRSDPAEQERQKLLEILDLTKEYYCYLLTEHEAGEAGRAYLKERGVTTESIKIFQLGYSLPAWDGLVAYLHGKKKYSLDDIAAAGLIAQGRSGQPYDRFRGRLMFPLKNHRGQVVGFSGRVLDPTIKEAKYINSPETQLYHKSQMLYGYSELYQFLRTEKTAVVVEGEFDVLSSAQAHINNVVAIKGSALTSDHLRLLSRVVEKVIFSLDVDAAGIKATKRAIELARELPLEIRVVRVPSGKDPDELARQDPAAWRTAVKGSISVYEFLLQAALGQFDATTPEGKRNIIDELAPVLSGIPHAVEQEVYIKKVATALGTKEETIRQDIRTFGHRSSRRVQTSPRSVHTAEAHTAQVPELPAADAYLLFLLFNRPSTEWSSRASELEAVTLAQPAESILAELRMVTTADRWLHDQAEDIRERIFEWQSQPRFVLPDSEEGWVSEWQTAKQAVSQAQVQRELKEIQSELAALDRVAELSAEQAQRQEELLKRIVVLKSQFSR